MCCSSNYECRESGDNYQVCIFGECQCQPNYNLTGEDLFCIFYNCSNSDECRKFDENRIFFNGSCVCNSIAEESMDEYLCEYSDFIVVDYTFVIILLLLIGFCLIIGLRITFRVNENRRQFF